VIRFGKVSFLQENKPCFEGVFSQLDNKKTMDMVF